MTDAKQIALIAEAMGGEDQTRSILAALFIVQAELATRALAASRSNP